MYYNPAAFGGMNVNKVFAGLTPANLYVFDFTQMVSNATNRFGTVNGSGNITNVNSVLPGDTTESMTNVNTVALSDGAAVCSDGNWLIQPSVTTDFDFTYVNATPANLKWTAFFVASITDNGTAGGLFGNNGLYAPNGGIGILGSSSGLGLWMFNGGTNVCVATFAGSVDLGSMAVYAMRLDFSLAAASGRVKAWRGTTEYNVTPNGTTSPMTTPNGSKFTLGDALTFNGGDATVDFKLFSIYDGAVSDAQVSVIMRNLSSYTGVAL